MTGLNLHVLDYLVIGKNREWKAVYVNKIIEMMINIPRFRKKNPDFVKINCFVFFYNDKYIFQEDIKSLKCIISKQTKVTEYKKKH